MNNPDVAGRAVGPRTWRAAVVLFLTVLLAGAGLTGASALWAQSGAVTAQVTTGTWVDYSRSGFTMPLKLAVKDAKWSGIGTRSIQMSWTNEAEVNAGTQKITYSVEATENSALRLHGRALPYRGSAAAVTFETTTPVWPFSAQSLKITVTPYVDGVAGTPTIKNLWLDRDGETWLTDVK